MPGTRAGKITENVFSSFAREYNLLQRARFLFAQKNR